MTSKNNSDIKKMSFEDAMSELQEIVNGLDSGNILLDNAIENYSRGSALKKHCQKKLKEAKLRIEKVVVENDGQISTEDFQNNN